MDFSVCTSLCSKNAKFYCIQRCPCITTGKVSQKVQCLLTDFCMITAQSLNRICNSPVQKFSDILFFQRVSSLHFSKYVLLNFFLSISKLNMKLFLLDIGPVFNLLLVICDSRGYSFIMLILNFWNQASINPVKIRLFFFCRFKIANIRIISLLQCGDNLIFSKIDILTIFITK